MPDLLTIATAAAVALDRWLWAHLGLYSAARAEAMGDVLVDVEWRHHLSGATYVSITDEPIDVIFPPAREAVTA
jgi:hypothetical protein